MKIEFNKVTWYSKLGAAILFLVIVPILAFYIGRQYQLVFPASKGGQFIANYTKGIEFDNSSLDFLDGTYYFDDQKTVLVHGKAEQAIAPGSASTLETAIFGEPVIGDMDGDGQKDAVFFVSQETGGTGIFFYVVAALNRGGTYLPTNAVFLGDRIAPQNIRVVNGVAEVNYAVRKDSDPMTADPSIGVTKYLQMKSGALVEKLQR